MTLEELGYSKDLENYRKENGLDSFTIARVISEHKDRYSVMTKEMVYDAELLGKLRFTAEDRKDLPAVGDWVAISEFDEGKALIHAVFPRTSIIQRKAVGKAGQSQIIATNIDYGLIIQSVNRDYSINRLERYLSICHSSNISPIVILSKIDLIDRSSLDKMIAQIKARLNTLSVFAISNETGEGLESLKSRLEKGKTYCLLGSSGVGKSTLINSLTQSNRMQTAEISRSIDRGKHVTSHRELIVLENGILIDNPGMREVGITSEGDGVEQTFHQFSDLAEECKFKDCTHIDESGCAILDALEEGNLDREAYSNFIKMNKERAHYESDSLERRRKDKDFGKMIKKVQKQRRNLKF